MEMSKILSNTALGIDLGGSKILAVVTDAENNVIAAAKNPTDALLPPEGIVKAMKATAAEALAKLGLKIADVDFAGAAVPSPVDPTTAEALFATNLSWKKASLKTLLRREFGRDVVLGNDGNLGILGEHFCGAAKGYSSSVGYFIGTGLGGGIIVNNELLLGKSGMAAELGHAIIATGGRRCGCGHRGCAEAYCSKLAFVKALKKEVFKRGNKTSLPSDKFDKNSKNIKSKYLVRAYAEGDPSVRKVVDKGLRMLGVAMASTCAVVAPECIVIGGCFAVSMGEAVLPPVETSFAQHLFGQNPKSIPIKLSTLGDNAVAVGATILARKAAEK